jgi:S1-C subfamily serine protease
MRRFGNLLLFGLCAFGGGIVGGGYFAQPPRDVGAQVPPDLPPPPPVADGGWGGQDELSDRFKAVVRQIGPSVVSIEATKPQSATRLQSVEESGSGVLLKLEGVLGTLVLTNNHVIAEAPPEKITVHLADDRIFRPDRVWTDPESDVAVLLLDEENLPVASPGDSELMEVGDWVLAFGSPFGLSQTVTHGIISARERGQISLGDAIRIKSFLQTDAAINPGSSGGPLVNLDGQVVGINTAIASQSGSNSGVAFAIPINLALEIARQLVSTGRVQRAYLGVQLAAALEPEIALGLGLDRARGALVESAYPNTPAADAGLRPNDVILEMDGQSIQNENQLINLIAQSEIGQTVRLRIWRDRAVQLVEVTVGDWSVARPRLQPRE